MKRLVSVGAALALSILVLFSFSDLLSSPVLAQSSPAAPGSPSPSQTQAPEQQPPTPFVMDGGSGPCSVEFTVTTQDGKPAFAALINVHMAYGFGGFRKLDLGVYTNHDGKAKFTGLPAKVKNPPVEFRATKDNLAGIATVDPATECQAKHDIILEAPKK